MINTIKNRIAEIDARMSALSDEAAERVFTAEEASELERLQSENAELARELKLREGIVAAKSGNSAPVRKTVPETRAAMSVTSNEKPFKNFGEMAKAVKLKARGAANDRVMNALSVYSNETTNEDGAVAVPGEFRTQIEKDIYGQSSLLSMVTRIPLTQNSVTFPVDNNGPWAKFSGSGHSSFKAEAAALDQAKPALTTLTLTAHKCGILVPVTEELEQDNAAFAAYLSSIVGEDLQYKINDQILQGVGTTECKGFLKSAALKTVASGSGQAAGTVTAENVKDMYFAMPAHARGNAVWVVNPNVEPQLYGMVISGTTQAAFVPGGSMANSPFSTLLGRPVLVLPNCPAVGDVGDISFVDLSKYWAVEKGGVKSDSSIHFYFDQVVNAYRFYVRIGGDTRRQSVITLPDATTQSYYVALAAR